MNKKVFGVAAVSFFPKRSGGKYLLNKVKLIFSDQREAHQLIGRMFLVTNVVRCEQQLLDVVCWQRIIISERL